MVNDIFSNISSGQWLILIIINALLLLGLFLMCLLNRGKLNRLREKYNKLMNGISSENIEQLLEETLRKVDVVINKNHEIENHINEIDRNILVCLKKVGVVRFNAFDNVGSDMSFSVALLDSNDNGAVISGLYSRESSATYAKPILSGKSKYPLSAEELKAIDIAKKTYH